MTKLIFYIGTTAELIKLASVIKELKKRKVEFKILTSGQVDVHFEDFRDFFGQIKADLVIKPKSKSSSIVGFAWWAIRALFQSLYLLRFENKLKMPYILIVHGDTVSSLIGAVCGKLLGYKVFHIESGLRSFNFFEPFPEEICRYLISIITDVHFCPNKWSMNNLKKKKSKKYNTNENTLYDIYKWAVVNGKNTYKKTKGDKYFVLVIHRQEHIIFGKQKSFKIFEKIMNSTSKGLTCVFLMHDISESFVTKIRSKYSNKKIIFQSRLPYPKFLDLLKRSEFVITDGGSNQEELYYMGKPTLIIRNVTERIEGLGVNAILFKNLQTISEFIPHYKNYKKHELKVPKNPGKTIVDKMVEYL